MWKYHEAAKHKSTVRQSNVFLKTFCNYVCLQALGYSTLLGSSQTCFLALVVISLKTEKT